MEAMTTMAYFIALVALLLCGWRAWTVLADEAPWVRTIGAVLSALVPVPVFLIVIVHHHARRQTASKRAGIPTVVQ
ncbi:MAG TPA: hypothetical protein VFF71_06410 [Luteimonas sp.]|nr:hypothetical protein [Luteimonas sp.]